MKLLLKNADGECVSVTVFPTDTFSDLKSRISEEDNIEIDIDEFAFEGKPIDNDMNVVEYFRLNTEQDVDVAERNMSLGKPQTCRLCAGVFDNSKLIDVFQVINKITTCLPIQIDKNDRLSKLVCLKCSSKLDDIKTFIDSCLEAEKKQLAILEKKAGNGDQNDCPICSIKDSNDVSVLSKSGLIEAIKSHSHNCIHSTSGPDSLNDEKGNETEKMEDEVDFPQVFCVVCQRRVKLVSFLKAECHEDGSFSCFLCETTLDGNEGVMSHLKEHFVEVIDVDDCQVSWKCLKCEVVSNDGYLFEKHFRGHVEEESSSQRQVYRCSMCSKSFRCENRLRFHLKFHTSGAKAGQCSECRKEFATELCLYKHMLYNHLERKVHTCEHCGRTFRNKSSLTYHFRSHSSLEAMKPFTCDICNKRFARKNILRDHMMNRHGSGAESQPRTCFQCRLCKEVFPNTDSAISHTEIHHPGKVDERIGYSFDMLTMSKLFICEYCDKCFSLPVNLIEHRLLHGDSPRFQCKMCNEEFGSFVEMKSHHESHVSDGLPDYKTDFNIPMLFMCPFCEKCFKNYQAFNVHAKTHTEEDSPYTCRFCPEVFRSYRDSAGHRLGSHTMEKPGSATDCLKPFQCQYCSKAFTSGSALTKHIRVHTGEKPYPCRICNKSFAQSSGLYTHLKVHSNDRPYQCDLCSRSFKIIGDYKQHVRRHSGLRSYVCDVCKKSFITQRSFSQHKKIHMNVRPYSCDVCQQSFRRSHTLKIHKLRHGCGRQ